METHKNSVFAGIFPASEPAPSAFPAPQALNPGVSEDQVASLNKKIELMERNIVGQLEKKFSGQAAPPPPPPPSPLVPAVLSKITEMEDRLKDFQDKFLLGAAQTKNSEESRISGRREIEELLKVVREQQKYTELDRQMHDQLEKAWARVEEMEKKMLEVYTAAARKPAEPVVPPVSTSEIAAAVLKAVDASLDERLAPLEAALKNSAAAANKPAEIAAVVLKAVDAGLEERLALLEAALKNAAVTAKNQAERAVPVATPAEIAAVVLKAVEAGLKERLAPVEAALQSAIEKIEAAPAAVDVRLAAYSSEIRQLHIDNISGKEKVDDTLSELKKGVIYSLTNSFEDCSGDFLRHIDAAALDGRERVDVLGKMLISHMDELAVRNRDNALKLEALGSCVRSENQKSLSAVSSMQYEIEKVLRAHIDEAASRTLAENTRQFEKIKEAYGLSVSYAPAIAAVAGNISEIEGRLTGVLAGLKTFIKDLAQVNLDAVLGVSGAIIRRSFESAGELAAGLEQEMVLLARRKGEIEASLKILSLRPGEEDK